MGSIKLYNTLIPKSVALFRIILFSSASSLVQSRLCFFFQAEDGIRDDLVTGVQTCALPIFADGAKLHVAVKLLGGIVLDEAISAVDLHAFVGAPHSDFAGEKLGHGRFQRRLDRKSVV